MVFQWKFCPLRNAAQMLVVLTVSKLFGSFLSDFGGEAIEMLVFPRVFKVFWPDFYSFPPPQIGAPAPSGGPPPSGPPPPRLPDQGAAYTSMDIL